MSSDVQNAIALSVQPDEQSVISGGSTGLGDNYSTVFGTLGSRSQYLARWGTQKRALQLRRLWQQYENTMVIGALTNLINREQQTPWELSGPTSTVERWHDILRNAEKGDGWDSFKEKLWQDYLGQDKGAFVEIIGQGKADTPLDRAAVGVSILDSVRCYLTGNYEYPVYYHSYKTGKWHKLHHTRVMRFVDMSSPDPAYRGNGLCALSRAAAVAETQYLMSRYRAEQLSDLPPKGFVSVSGVDREQFADAMNTYQAQRDAMGAAVFGGLMQITSPNPTSTVNVEVTPFATMDDFDYTPSMDADVKLLALAIGDDPLEIWPLTGAGLNNSGQAQTLHAKGKSRMLGKMRTLIERKFNHNILPRNLELKYKPVDTEQDKQDAEKAQTWINLTTTGYEKGVLTLRESRELLANTVSAYRDVLIDESGQLRLVDDDIPSPEQTEAVDVTLAEDETQDTPDNAEIVEDTETPTATREKDILSTQVSFEDDFEALVNEAAAGNLPRRRFVPAARSILSRAINRAYEDGLEDGGVNPLDKSASDNRTITRFVTEANSFLRNLSAQIYERGLSPDQLAQKPTLWFNGSVSPAFEAGRFSADRNGYYQWRLGMTEKHCSDCLTLDGQIHRIRDYVQSGWLPQARQLECNGYNCDCDLRKRTDVRASGRFPRKSLHDHDHNHECGPTCNHDH